MSNYSILKDKNNKTKNIFNQLNVETLSEVIKNNKGNNNHIIIKLGATWCGPCRSIKDLCNTLFLDMPDNVICYDIDVDNNFELYGSLRTKKMVKGIPAIFHYNCKLDRPNWYISDNFISGSDNQAIIQFFQKVQTLANEN